MVARNKGLLENIFLGVIGVSCLTTIYGLMLNKSAIASIGTTGVAGSIMLWRESNREDNLTQLREDSIQLSRISAELTHAELLLNGFKDSKGNLINVDALKQHYEALRVNLSQTETRLKELTEKIGLISGECESLKLEKNRLIGQIETFEATKQKWSRDFDTLCHDHDLELKAKDREISSLVETIQTQKSDLIKYQAQFENVDELAKLRAGREAQELKDSLEVLRQTHSAKMAEYVKLAETYNELNAEYQIKLKDFNEQFAYLSGSGFKEVEETFNAELTDRDRMLLEASRKLTELEAPQLFEAIGEYDRANRLIKALWESDEKICLDASEIVPYPDQTGFDVYFNLRDRKSRGQAFIEALNHRGNELSVVCGCIKDLKFEYDRINPHRIKTALVFRKAQKTKDTIAKDWKTADQFVSIAGKWSRVRITGGSESGKSPLAEMVAGSMQQIKPSVQIQLAFPKDGSEKNHWGIPVTFTGWKGCLEAAIHARNLMNTRDKGEDKTKYFYAAIIDETDTALDKHSELATEIKALIKSGSHNNVGLILCGQNANVRQWKGFDRSDFENVVNVHIGSNAYHAIENSNLSETEKKRVKETADKLTTYCEGVNESIEDEDVKTRFALVLEPNKKPYFLEIPRFGSIVYDSHKASTILTEKEITDDKPIVRECQHTNSIVRKTYRDKEGNPIRRNRKCKECGKSFTEHLIESKTDTHNTR